MRKENKIEYPCTDCEEERDCEEQETFAKCDAWRKWFHQRWEKIRSLFAHDVSNRHEDEEGDDE